MPGNQEITQSPVAAPVAEPAAVTTTKPAVPPSEVPPPVETGPVKHTQPETPQPKIKELTPASEDTRRQETENLFHNTMMLEAAKAEQKLAKKEKLTADEMRFLRYKRTYEHSQAKQDENFASKDPNGRGVEFDQQPIYIRFENGKWVPTAAGTGQRINEVPRRIVRDGTVYFECNVNGATNNPQEIEASIVLQSLTLSGRETYLKAFGEGTARR